MLEIALWLCLLKEEFGWKSPQASLDGEDPGSVGGNSPAISFPIEERSSWFVFGNSSAIALVAAAEVFDPVVAGDCWHSLDN